MNATLKKGQKIKFVVSSAEEGVNLIREKMGPQAKVISVRQVEGRGLAKFLTAPRLEIIAAMPGEETEAKSAFTAEEKALLEENPAAARPKIENTAAGGPPSKLPRSSSIKSLPAEQFNPPSLESILRSSGFENSLIQRFKTSTDWEKLQSMSVKAALADLALRLRIDCDAIEVPPVAQTIAFIGSSGTGKTTALCKHLAHEVFFEKRSVQVLKLDGDSPNSDTALALYCEVMGVPLIRDPKLAEPTRALLIDTSGVSMGDTEEITALGRSLDSLGVKTRVWVINAAYENSVIDRGLAIAEELRATHAVYTHLDEIMNTSRLWHFILSGHLKPLFGSTGPGVAHDRTTKIGSVLLPKTFPDYLLK